MGEQNWLKQGREAISGETVSVLGDSIRSGSPLRIFGSKDAMVLIAVWSVGNWIVIYLAAMGDVPKPLYESAEIDGFNGLRKFWHITLPMLSPVIFFNLVMGLIRSVQAFTSFYIISEGTGSPNESMLVLSLHLFLSAFSDLDMGYASAIAWVLFLVLVVSTVALFRTSKHWVHYRGRRNAGNEILDGCHRFVLPVDVRKLSAVFRHRGRLARRPRRSGLLAFLGWQGW